jgi:hypothetical protein
MDLATFRARLGRRAGFDGNTSRLDGFINDAIQHIHGWRQDWSWARRTKQFQTRAVESGAAATVTNNSRTVSGLAAALVTRSGARIGLPDGVVYDITADATLTSQVYLTTPYTGATVAGAAAWKLYRDTYPLPPDCSQIESVVLTGNGWTYHIEQQSLNPPHMKRLTIKDYESYPQYYAIETANPIPAPWVLHAVADDAGGTLLANGTYKVWYAFRDNSTGEEGPLSESVSVTTTGTPPAGRLDITGIQVVQDYGKRLYRSVVGGDEPLFLGDAAANSTSRLNDETLDSALGLGNSAGEFIGAHPQHGHIQKIRLWPPPDDEYIVSLSYFAHQPDLFKDNDVPVLPARFHQVALDYAQALYMREQENWPAASRLEQRVITMIEKMALEQDSDPNTSIQIGRGTPSTEGALRGGGRWPRWLNQ